MPDNNQYSMTDDDREVLNKFYREEHEKIAKQESEKAFLKDNCKRFLSLIIKGYRCLTGSLLVLC